MLNDIKHLTVNLSTLNLVYRVCSLVYNINYPVNLNILNEGKANAEVEEILFSWKFYQLICVEKKK